MTAPLTTLRSKLNGADEKRAAMENSQVGEALSTHKLDSIIEWTLSKRGREDAALLALALSSVALIFVLRRYA